MIWVILSDSRLSGYLWQVFMHFFKLRYKSTSDRSYQLVKAYQWITIERLIKDHTKFYRLQPRKIPNSTVFWFCSKIWSVSPDPTKTIACAYYTIQNWIRSIKKTPEGLRKADISWYQTTMYPIWYRLYRIDRGTKPVSKPVYFDHLVSISPLSPK